MAFSLYGVPKRPTTGGLLWGQTLYMDTPLPYCVYILFSEKDRLLYIGYSSNLEKRIETHNAGGNKSTAYRRPLRLIFCEFYLFEEDSRKREAYFKTAMGKKAIRLMLNSNLQKLGYKNGERRKIEIICDTDEIDT